jgi:hypothetical protein
MQAGEEIPCGQATAPASDQGCLGAYDINSRTQSLAGLQEAERLVAIDVEQLTSQFPEGVPAPVARELRRKHDLYYRVRAHERAHYYQGASTAAEVARTYAENDLVRFLFTVLESIPAEQDVWLPLLRWGLGGTSGCPPRLVSIISRFRTAEIVYAALDGDADAAEGESDRIRWFFPAARQPLASDPGFQLGRRYLAEGAAKAAEWIYVLCAEPQSAIRAELDIAGSPEVYRRAISYVQRLIPHVPLPGQLQAVVLAADLALHPEIPAQLWPDVYAAEAADAALLAPGPRFALVAGLLPSIPAAAFSDKAALAVELTARTKEVLGWPDPDQATRAAIAALDTVLAAPRNAKLLAMLEGNSHPVRKMRMTLEVRLEDQYAFVPPVNASLINARQLAPSGFRGSALTPLGATDLLLEPERVWFSRRLARQLIYAHCPECPLRADDSYLTEFKTDNACSELTSGQCQAARTRTAVRREFLACGIIGEQLSRHLGSGWRTRLRFFISSEDPGTVRRP